MILWQSFHRSLEVSMKEEFSRLLREKSRDSRLSWSDQIKLVEETGLTLRAVEDKALVQGILPIRYQRNVHAISVEEQYRLFKARVAVVGCGGLGGYVIEELARIGVGSITAWDYDYFEEHNLNPVSYTHLRAHETDSYLVCRLL